MLFGALDLEYLWVFLLKVHQKVQQMLTHRLKRRNNKS